MRGIYLSFRFMVACSIMSLLYSCEHRRLEDPINTHYVRVYLDEQIKNVTCGFYNDTLDKPEYERPAALRAILANPETGEIVSERILHNHGDDGRGHYIDGHIAAPAGVYDFMAYEIGSTITNIRNENNMHSMLAYTNKIDGRLLQYLPSVSTAIDNDRIVSTPEHMSHVAKKDIRIYSLTHIDTLRDSNGDYFTASSLVLSYFIQVKVKGIKWVKAAATLMGGMAGSAYMRDKGELNVTDPVYVFFGLNNPNGNSGKRTQNDADEAYLYATFNTFGKIPDIPTLYTLNFEFTKSDNSTQVETIDITEMFDTPLVKNNQWILLDKIIEITPPTGSGGMKPGVEGWKDIEADIIL